jgi:hypothetical protein
LDSLNTLWIHSIRTHIGFEIFVLLHFPRHDWATNLAVPNRPLLLFGTLTTQWAARWRCADVIYLKKLAVAWQSVKTRDRIYLGHYGYIAAQYNAILPALNPVVVPGVPDFALGSKVQLFILHQFLRKHRVLNAISVYGW